MKCHSKLSKQVGGNLYLDTVDGWKRGGELGPAIVAGKPDQSLIMKAVRYQSEDLQMPPDGQLSDYEVRILQDWIKMGAPDPRTAARPAAAAEIDLERRRLFWAFQSPHGKTIPIPVTKNSRWQSNPLDAFVLAELQRRDLAPSASADKRTLIRRATYDLIGLPPTPNEINSFLTDTAPDAYAKMIERLLASPHYGERWGRFWLDVARYADSNGLDENIAHGNAWRYRNYVIRSFNHDKPYSRFVREQIAGDLLPKPSSNSQCHDQLIATGFLSLGPKVLAEVDERKMEMDIIDEQVETVGRAFMGMTFGCARCHDHKFDPIRTEDYYALAGIFKSTKTMDHFTKIARWHELTVADNKEQRRFDLHQSQIDQKQQAIDGIIKSEKDRLGSAEEKKFGAESKAKLAKLRQALKQLKESAPVLTTAMGVADYKTASDLRVHIRGNHLTQGDLVPRGFPLVFASTASQPDLGPSTSGRLQLADWLVDGRHPLVARVIVNRIWRWHFGRGLVETTDNFGQLGNRPVNQRLLDWLAAQFVKDDWSLKALHRRIMLSSTYKMASSPDAAKERIDQENRYQWRANLRRLEAEAIRDAMLAVAGKLDKTPGTSQLHVKNREFLFDHTSKDKTKYDSTARSVYLPIIRNHLYDVFQLFDYADASVPNSDRPTTTVAPQALFMMNGELVNQAAAGFAKRVLSCGRTTDEERLRFAFELAYGRLPTPQEIARDLEFLKEMRSPVSSPTESNGARRWAWEMLCHALLMANEFVYVR